MSKNWTSQFFLSGSSERSMGIHAIGSAVENHISPKRARELIDCNISNYVPFMVPGSSASSSSTTLSPTSQLSSSQDSVFDVNRHTDNPVPERSVSTSEELRGDPLHESTEVENKKKRNQKKYKEIHRTNCLIGCRILVDESTSTKPWETQSREVKTFPSRLMNFQWSRKQKWNRVRVSTEHIRTFRRTQIVMSACRQQRGLLAEDALVQS